MLTLKDYVNWGITHSDKTGSAEGVPLVMENCVKNKKMKQLEVYGNSIQNGTPSPEAPVEVESVGDKCAKNLLNDNRKITSGKGDYAETKGSTITLGSGGNASPVQLIMSYSTANSLTLKAGVTYTWSVTRISGSIENTSANPVYLGFRGVNGSWVRTSASINVALGMFKGRDINKITFTVESDTVCSFAYVGMAYADSCVYALQLEEGSVATEYEPYGKYKVPVVVNGEIFTNVYLNEPLRKVGDYADVLDFKGKKVIRNTYKRVYDGVNDNNNPFNMYDNESNFELSSEYDNFRRYSLSDPLPVIPKNGHADYNHKPLCVQFPTFARPYDSTSAQKVSEEQIWFTNVGRNINLFLSKSREGLGDGSTSAFRAYLKENPITVYCAIYEPYEEPIECELPVLTAKTSIVEIDTSLLPSNIKGKYIKK